MTPEEVPGGYTSQQEALDALNRLSMVLNACIEQRERLEHGVRDLADVIQKLARDKQEAAAAVVIFAETCPPDDSYVSSKIASVQEQAALLIADAEEVLRQARGKGGAQ